MKCCEVPFWLTESQLWSGWKLQVSFLRQASHLLLGALEIVCNVVNNFRLVCHFKNLAMLYWWCSQFDCKLASLYFVWFEVGKYCPEYLKRLLVFSKLSGWLAYIICRSIPCTSLVVGSDRSTCLHTWWHKANSLSI